MYCLILVGRPTILSCNLTSKSQTFLEGQIVGSIQFEKVEQNAGAVYLDISENNAFTATALDELSEALMEANKEANAGGIKSLLLLSKREGFFSAGLDLTALGEGADIKSVLNSFYKNLNLIYNMPVPVISGIRGHALGYGCMLALMGDYRLMTDSGARVGLPEVKLAVRIPSIIIYEMQKVVGYAEANRQVLEGSALKSQEALACGYADSLHPELEIEKKCLSIASRFKKSSSAGLASIREASRMEPAAFQEMLKRDLAENLKSLDHPEAKEGLAAAREGRRPRFPSPS